jgi:hypothetical protein
MATEKLVAILVLVSFIAIFVCRDWQVRAVCISIVALWCWSELKNIPSLNSSNFCFYLGD